MTGSKATVISGDLSIVPRGGSGLVYQTKVPGETAWSYSLIRPGFTSQATTVYVRDALMPFCEISVPIVKQADIVAAPRNLTLQQGSSGSQLIASWLDMSSNETGFELQFSTDSLFSSIYFQTTVPVNSSGYTSLPTQFNYSNRYYARVRAFGQAGYSEYSNTASAITIPRVDMPRNLVVSSITSNSFVVGWDPVIGATDYRVFYSPNDTFYNQIIVTTTAQALFINNLNANTKYYIKVTTRNTEQNVESAAAGIQATTIPATVVLLPPTNVTLTPVQDNFTAKLAMAWTDNTSGDTQESLFRIQYSTNATFSQIVDATVGANNTAATLSGLNYNTQYFARIRAESPAGVSAWSSTAVATTITPTVSAPTSLAVTSATVNSVTYSWQYPYTGHSGFTMETATDANFTVGKRTTTLPNTSNTATISSLNTNTTYYARVRADRSDGFSSAWSNVVAATTQDLPKILYPIADLKVTPQSNTFILSGTNTNSVEFNYRIDTSNTGQFTGPPASNIITQFRSTVGQNLLYTTPTLVTGKTYTFRVLCWEPGYSYANGDGWSNYVTVTVQGPPAPTAPAAPSGLTGSSPGPTQLNFVWTDNATNEDGQEIQLSTQSTFPAGSSAAILSPNTTSYSFLDLSPATTYYARVRASNAGGTSNWSNVAIVTTNSAPVASPTLSGTNTADNTSVTLNWQMNGVTNVILFQMQQQIDDGAWGDYAQSWSGTVRSATIAQSPGTSIFRYRLKVYATTGVSDWSNTAVFVKTNVTTGDNTNALMDYSYQPTYDEIKNNSWDPNRTMQQFQIARDESPFWNNNWLNPIGITAGKPLVTDFGYGATNQQVYSVPKEKRFIELSQQGTLGAISPEGNGNLTDPSATGAGGTYSTDYGNVTPTTDHYRYNFFRVNINNIGNNNSDYGSIRWDIEIPESSNMMFWLNCRQTWEGGKYRKAANGGTNADWKNVSDIDFYNQFVDQYTRVMVVMLKNAIANMGADGTKVFTTFYGEAGHSTSPMFDRVVKINGVKQPTIKQLVTTVSTNDIVSGHYAYKPMFASDNDNGKWMPIDVATAPMKETVVTGTATRYRVIQLNDINSRNPQLRMRLEDENGNICKNDQGKAFRISVSYKTAGGQLGYENSWILRSENDQVPDQTVTLGSTFGQPVDVAAWKRGSILRNVRDKAIGNMLARAWSDKDIAGNKPVINQVYPYVVQECCIQYGTCGNGVGGQGQCEDNSTAAVDVRTFEALWSFRAPRKIYTALWQVNPATKSVNAVDSWNKDFKGNVGDNARANSYKALQAFNKYRPYISYKDSVVAVPFEISFDGGSTWKTHTNYLAVFTNANPDITTPNAAVMVSYNVTTGKAFISGTPLYVDSITPQIRYTIPGKTLESRSLALDVKYENGFYHGWYTP